MGLFINTNVASLNAQRNLTSSTTQLSRSFQRLSTGKRINSARDDAAGLAISTRFTAQIRGLNQAVRNTNDGISMAQTIEGALQESTNILQRMRELSVQAANDINTAKDRESINSEIQQLISELNRIGDTTTFNNQKVINGDFVQSFFHVGANAYETLGIRVRDARATNLGLAAVQTTDTPVGDGVFDRLNADGQVLINGVTIRTTDVTDDTLSTTLQSSSAIAKAAAINDMSEYHGVTARVLETRLDGNADIQGGLLDSTNYFTLNGQVITGFTVVGDDANGELLAQINAISAKTGVIASLDDDQRLVLTAVDGRNIDITIEGNADQFTGLAEATTFAALELRSEDQFTVDGNANALAAIGFANNQIVGVTRTNSVASVDVLTRDAANRAIEVLDRALAQIAQDRSDLGAVQNRLESTVSNLSTVSENLTASRSRIEDADFAEESAQLARNQILQQAGASILAQANQSGQVALSLLG
ncbi:MAG: flagellin [Myxococcales bacterium]|nr:flagellin [Myxococcales bacterium]